MDACTYMYIYGFDNMLSQKLILVFKNEHVSILKLGKRSENNIRLSKKIHCLQEKPPYGIAGLHVTSQQPCWWSRTKAFLSAGN